MLEKLGEVLRKATNRLANAIFLDKNLVDSIIRDLQRSLIEADVNVLLVKQITDKIKKSDWFAFVINWQLTRYDQLQRRVQNNMDELYNELIKK